MSVDVTDIKYLRSVEAVVIKVKRLLESNSKVLQERYFVSFNKLLEIWLCCITFYPRGMRREASITNMKIITDINLIIRERILCKKYFSSNVIICLSSPVFAIQNYIKKG